jgi:uncharacterized protein (TIGR03437 family)
MIFAIASGPQAGNVYSIAGPILAAYTGPGSNLGVPTDAEYSLNGLEQQDFEGGYMQYSPGDTVAQIYLAPLVPTVTATPASAPAGSVVRLTLGGFNPNAQVSVSISGQQSFIATVPTGAYVWQTYIPANAASSTVTINATDTNSQASAQASYSIRGAASANISLQTVRGDQQTGLPGATLTLPIQVQLADNSGVPIPNANVYFTPSPGGAIANGSSVTESNGMASVNWRLPPQDGLAILSVDAGGYLISASASAAHSGLPNFPVMSQAGVSTVLGNGASPISSSGALLVSAAAALLYYQNRGDLPQPDGPANAPSLNAFLKTACGTDSTGAPVCDGFIQPAGASDQIVNLWRLGGFVGNAVTIRTITPDQNLIRDSIAQGAPVILALTLTVNGAPGGSHFVVATGVDASGNLNLMDPNPAYAQGSLYGYLNGFQSSTGQTISGVLSGAAVVTPQVPANPGFLIAVNAPLSVQSPAGQCGAAFSFSISNGAFALQYCDESAGQFYELDLAPADSNTNFQGTFIDLSSFSADSIFSGTGATSYSINGSSGQWMFAPLAVQFQASNVVEQANPAGGLAPGALASITGTGLTTPGSPPVVTVNGETAQLINATPFELDFQIPMDAAAGSAVLDVTSDVDGSEEQTITLQPVAPAIQILPGGLGLITNQDGSANTPYNPALRGQTITVFGSGFGTLPASVQAFVGGTPVTVSSVSQAPNSPGLFELSIAIPATLPPGSSLSLVLGQGPAISNAVNIAIQ